MSTATADHLRESILDVLAQSDAPMTSAEIYEQIDSAESKQLLYAQINYLRKAGQIHSETTSTGAMLHTLIIAPADEPEPDPELEREAAPATEIATEISQTSFSLADADLHRVVWSQPHGTARRFLTITLDGGEPRLNTSGSK